MKERLSIAEMMRNGWLYYSDGYRTKKPELGPTGFPIMRVAQVLDGYLGPASNPEFVRDEYKKKIGQKSSINGDVILTTKGTVGRMARIWAKDEGYVYSPQVCFFRVLDESRIDRAYLYYAMAGEDFRQQMQAVSTQTDMAPYINLKDLGRLEIDVPEFAEQRSIASILGALDDKIELNRRMSGTLEALAQAVFKEWFVEKAEEGWQSGTLGDVATQHKAGIKPEDMTAEMAYIGLEHMPQRSIALADWSTAESLESNKFRFSQGDILFGKLRSYFHKVGVAPVDGVCSTDIVVVRPKAPEWFGFVLGHTSSKSFVDHTSSGATGTRMPRTSWQDMARYELALPPRKLAEEFTAVIQPMIQKITVNIHESRTLAALRDTLLPKLMRGEVRVKQTELMKR